MIKVIRKILAGVVIALLFTSCAATEKAGSEVRCRFVKDKRMVGMAETDGTVRWNYIIVSQRGYHVYVTQETYLDIMIGDRVCAPHWYSAMDE